MDSEEEAVALLPIVIIDKKTKAKRQNEETGQFWLNLAESNK